MYGAVNDYIADFDPCNQVDFRHLVTVNITQGNWEIYGLTRLISTLIGLYVKSILGADHKHISLVLKTTRKIFPPHDQIQLHKDKITTMVFYYVGRNLRCCFCFSYRHLPAHYRHPHPTCFANKILGRRSPSSAGHLLPAWSSRPCVNSGHFQIASLELHQLQHRGGAVKPGHYRGRLTFRLAAQTSIDRKSNPALNRVGHDQVL